jgi:hypothetical protein
MIQKKMKIIEKMKTKMKKMKVTKRRKTKAKAKKRKEKGIISLNIRGNLNIKKMKMMKTTILVVTKNFER